MANKIQIDKNKLEDFEWGSWCYKLMENLDKSLLKNQDIVKAFNDFANICLKYKDELKTHNYIYLKKSWTTFDPSMLTFSEKHINWKGELDDDPWCGLRFYFKNEYWKSKTPQEVFDKMREEVVASYKKLNSIIGPLLIPKMTARYNMLKLKEDLRNKQIMERKYRKNVTKEMTKIENKIKEIRSYEKNINEYTQLADTCQLEIDELKMKIKSLE